MNKFCAEVRFRDENSVAELVAAFFKDFNPESSIVVKGKYVILEVVFANSPPVMVAEALKNWEYLRCHYGDTTIGPMAVEKEPEEVSEPTFQEVESEGGNELQNDVTKPGRVSTPVGSEEQLGREREHFEAQGSGTEENARSTTASKQKNEDNKVATKDFNLKDFLDAFAQKSTSYEDFLWNVGQYLHMKSHQEYFEALVIAASQIDGHLKWKKLKSIAESINPNFAMQPNIKIMVERKIIKIFKETTITPLIFIKELSEYKDYIFDEKRENSQQNADSTEPEDKETEFAGVMLETAEGDVAESKKSDEPRLATEQGKLRLKMSCMPEIQEFEENLGMIDWSQSPNEIIRYILNFIGVEKLTPDAQVQIFAVAEAAYAMPDQTELFEILKAALPAKEEVVSAQLTFSKFINDFVKKYDAMKKVRLIDFLNSLKAFIRTNRLKFA